MALTLSRSKVTRTSPNCKVIGVDGSLKSSSAGRRINWPLSATTNEPLVDLRSRTEALPCASTETMACRFDMDLFVSIMSRRANPSSARGRNGLRPISTLSPLPSFFSSVPSTLTVHCCARSLIFAHRCRPSFHTYHYLSLCHALPRISGL